MTFAATVKTVTDQPSAIAMNESGSRVGLSYLLQNTGTVNIYLGGPDVNTSDKKFTLFAAGGGVTINRNKSDTLFAVIASGTTGSIELLKQDD